MQAIRVRFTKQSSARFISHLDLNRCFLRAVRRANLPIWYTQGFNPHPYITFALPLSIFYGSTCEVMDARLDGEMSLAELKDRLARQMPTGIEVYDVYEPEMKAVDTAFSQYEIVYEFDGKKEDELRNLFEGLLIRENLNVEKVTKHGVRIVDVKACLTDEGTSYDVSDGVIRLTAVLPSSPQENLNPSCFAAALKEYAGLEPDFETITRTAIYNKERIPFR